jgi:hypothetical protein
MQLDESGGSLGQQSEETRYWYDEELDLRRILFKTDTKQEHWHQNSEGFTQPGLYPAIQTRTVPCAVPRQPTNKWAVEKTIAAFSFGLFLSGCKFFLPFVIRSINLPLDFPWLWRDIEEYRWPTYDTARSLSKRQYHSNMINLDRLPVAFMFVARKCRYLLLRLFGNCLDWTEILHQILGHKDLGIHLVHTNTYVNLLLLLAAWSNLEVKVRTVPISHQINQSFVPVQNRYQNWIVTFLLL